MRYGTLLPGIALALVGCSGGGGGGGKDKDGTTEPVDPFTLFVDPTDEADGDFGAFVPSADPTWIADAADPAKQGTFPLSGLVEDFETGDPVSNASVALYLSDSVAGTPDDTADGDVNGLVSFGSAPACTPLTYRTSTSGGLEPTKTTYESHQVYAFPEGAAIEAQNFLSVSETTYQLIPGVLGISVQPDLSIIAGTAYDATRDPLLPSDDPSGKIEHVQIVVYGEDGEIPDTLGVNYFTEEFPDRDLAATSADGLWVASNVPPGRNTVEMWGLVGGEVVKLGATVVDTTADTIVVSNLYAGRGDGVRLPDSCLPAR